jgi:hypothetical protein
MFEVYWTLMRIYTYQSSTLTFRHTEKHQRVGCFCEGNYTSGDIEYNVTISLSTVQGRIMRTWCHIRRDRGGTIMLLSINHSRVFNIDCDLCRAHDGRDRIVVGSRRRRQRLIIRFPIIAPAGRPLTMMNSAVNEC